MESEEPTTEDRARKRRKKGNQYDCLDSRGRVETRAKALVGRYVKKFFEGNGVFLGKVVSYSSGLYRVDYEDGDFEDLDCGEIREFLVAVGDFDDDLNTRKMKLDNLISSGDSRTPSRITEQKAVTSANGFDSYEAPTASKLNSELESGSRKSLESGGIQLHEDADSFSDSCEYVPVRESFLEAESPFIPPPLLPPSSGNLGVPEEIASHLFSVYNFLRSFSIQLFLSPFGLDDFVGSLNCVVPNTLLDAIHVALLRALRRHLEMLSSDGAECASKCLRRINWSLLDTMTWPVYLIEYLLVMGYTNGPEWKGFYADVLNREYYTLSVTKKLMILQIVCDDVLESAELRTEIDMRESLEVGAELGEIPSITPENGPRRVHPRYAKTSACKDSEAMEIISDKPHDSKSPSHSNHLGINVPGVDANVIDIDQDGNSDECRLCGMDGTLICCDGCPSAYHSRCIGLNKINLPEGSWFCPECMIHKEGPDLRVGMGLRGAEFFGIDPYEQVFLGTCNHLLVLKASIHAGPTSRYYNKNDIPNVLRVLCSSAEHATMYSAICKNVLKYWEIPEDKKDFLPEGSMQTIGKKEDPMFSTLSDTLSHKDNPSSTTESNMESKALSGWENDFREAGFTSLGGVNHAGLQSHGRGDGATSEQVCEVTNTKPHEQSAGSICHQADSSELTHQSSASRSAMLEFANYNSGSKKGPKKDEDDLTLTTSNGFVNVSSEIKEEKHSDSGTRKGKMTNDCPYMGSAFKPQAYMNLYILGDVAATAAANLAVLSSEEKHVSGLQASVVPRNFVSSNVSLQVKAFSSAVFSFCWPNSEKKLTEVQRGRCGWCLSCKALTTCKKGCLLNLAASNALKGPGRILSGLRSLKNADGNIHGIATYILYMEESLRGLLLGPFLATNYRKQWRKQVEQASSCTSVKLLLLKLEENIRPIAFSAEWAKLVDDRSVESSVAQSASHLGGSTQKRGPGRRKRKQSTASEIITDPSQDNLRDVNWWRGGKLSKLVFQKGILPCSVVKRAARQGGSRKISGIYYAEGSEIPRRSRQFAWRTAVEMSKNASQLALQVRYLDLHLRWSDLDKNFQDGKGPETETSAYRNAVICDKKIQENKIRYGLAFGNQKHLPSRVLKNILEVEHVQDGEDKFWFSEAQVPLYLIKEYEEKMEKVPLPSVKEGSHLLSKLQIRQLRTSRRDIFTYLVCKAEKLEKCSCASCQQDVLLGNAVKCSSCKGYCHKDCVISSTVHAKDEVEFLITCNKCYRAKIVTLNEVSKKSLITQVSLQAQEKQEFTITEGTKQNGYLQPFLFTGNMDTHQEMKAPTPKSKSATKVRRVTNPTYGLIWRKKNAEDTGTNFRLSNILCKGNSHMDPPRAPICRLCRTPYNPDLMYICCETCRNWYHADALQLEESKIFDVVGFRCCKCRRNRAPICPYMVQECRKPPRMRASKQSSTGMGPVSGSSCGQIGECEFNRPDTKMEEVIIEENDLLGFSVEMVEPTAEPSLEVGPEWSSAGPQKLPVRRQKHEKDADVLNPSPVPSYVVSTFLEPSNHLNATEKASSPRVENVEWEFSADGLTNEMINYGSLNYEDMEFEPQTYFSFTELLASDDDQLDLFDAPMDISGGLGNSSGSGALTSYNPPEQYRTDTIEGNHDLATALEPTVNKIPCDICSYTEPATDLSCEVCGMWIHSHCSPWVEPSWGDRWKCGNCRDWR
ncbi:PREDICTED: DDT domain-containing protein PTM [Nelumbo nucifera]|uniref:DDT domain-containing protein PTM n=2 Tax=Nelumbo nucifera TaxID=4432 RepID=A0A1U7YVP8_NELNU|nr:PREDICTED: DDT domain-containing protein PTM [Nelumbo nucifera]DAD48686.1 TPA_asm: hypothetical protein HUJ06_018623 [Nelumbo nucifera]